jgi:hypothetical protein
MSSPVHYESHLSTPAAAFIVSLPRKKQRFVLDLADQLARHPFRLGDFRTADAVGHEIENLLVDDILLTYWVDHATREVRITEIIKV